MVITGFISFDVVLLAPLLRNRSSASKEHLEAPSKTFSRATSGEKFYAAKGLG
jgi:hypothetical protein